MFLSLSLSSLSNLFKGIPVHIETTSEISSSVTSIASLDLPDSYSFSSSSTIFACSNSSSRNCAAFSYCCEDIASSFHLLIFSNSFLASLSGLG